MPAAVAIPLITAAIGTGTTITAAKMASNSAKRASKVTEKADNDTFAIEQARDAEAKRQFDITEANHQREMAAAEEERAFARQQAEIAARDREYQQQLLREREQRAAPYRAMSQQALGNLGSLLGIDMRGSALAQNLSAPRSTGQTAPAPPQATPPSLPSAPPLRHWGNYSPTQGGTMPFPPVTNDPPTLGDLIAQQQRGVSRAY